VPVIAATSVTPPAPSGAGRVATAAAAAALPAGARAGGSAGGRRPRGGEWLAPAAGGAPLSPVASPRLAPTAGGAVAAVSALAAADAAADDEYPTSPPPSPARPSGRGSAAARADAAAPRRAAVAAATAHTAGVGTSLYMSAEQADGGGGGYDERVDVFALGLLTFEIHAAPFGTQVRARRRRACVRAV
jgi:hypothetical protein